MSLHIALTQKLEICHALRREVFIEEQGVSEADEIDDLDAEALHLLAYRDGAAVGTARILLQGDVAKIGRVCVLRSERGHGLGKALIRKALDVTQGKARRAKLGAQIQAIGFYEALGFEVTGPVYQDAGIDHKDMVRDL